MGRIGLPELLIVLVVVLLLFGAGRIPEIMKSLGRGFVEFKSALAGKPAKGNGRRGGRQ